MTARASLKTITWPDKTSALVNNRRTLLRALPSTSQSRFALNGHMPCTEQEEQHAQFASVVALCIKSAKVVLARRRLRLSRWLYPTLTNRKTGLLPSNSRTLLISPAKELFAETIAETTLNHGVELTSRSIWLSRWAFSKTPRFVQTIRDTPFSQAFLRVSRNSFAGSTFGENGLRTTEASCTICAEANRLLFS